GSPRQALPRGRGDGRRRSVRDAACVYSEVPTGAPDRTRTTAGEAPARSADRSAMNAPWDSAAPQRVSLAPRYHVSKNYPEQGGRQTVARAGEASPAAQEWLAAPTAHAQARRPRAGPGRVSAAPGPSRLAG